MRLPLLACVLLSVARLTAAEAPATLEVDAREAPRKILHARLVLPVTPGPQTLVYPEWIPGEHAPSGPIADLAGLQFSSAGKSVAWKRDPVDMFAFHVEVPAGATSLEVALDFLSPASAGGFSSGSSATASLALVSWNQLLLSPKGRRSDDLVYTASLRLPAGWKYGTALPVTRETPERIEFAPVSLTTLVDSPVLAGAHFRTVGLGEAPPRHQIHIAADSEAALLAPPDLVAAWTQLVLQTGALFGARHYRSYSFLLTLSDHTAHFGLEHHESSDDRVAERSLVDPDPRLLSSGLLPHEMTHSWNGKYRRPTGLATGDYETPMQGELLWVYEGLTTYLGGILTARSGLITATQYRDVLAFVAAEMDHQGGRAWRPLVDTAVAAQVLYGARKDWAARRRSVDFYPESELLWLEADTIIRRQSNGTRSLDDFCRRFFGGKSGPPALVPYDFDDVVKALGEVQPYDWRGFWTARLSVTGGGAPLAGLHASGWKLVYDQTRSTWAQALEEERKMIDARFSLGFIVDDTEQERGLIPDVLPGSPAERAGIGPGMKLVAVDGRRFQKKVLRDAIAATRDGHPIELLVENGEFFTSYKLDWAGGERYPHLERDSSTPDLLSQVVAPAVAGGR